MEDFREVQLKLSLTDNLGGSRIIRRPPLPFFENWQKVPWFCKKCPDSVLPSVKFSIQNVVLRVSMKRNSKIFPCGAFFFFCFWRNFYRGALIPWNLPCPEKIPVARLDRKYWYCLYPAFGSTFKWYLFQTFLLLVPHFNCCDNFKYV